MKFIQMTGIHQKCAYNQVEIIGKKNHLNLYKPCCKSYMDTKCPKLTTSQWYFISLQFCQFTGVTRLGITDFTSLKAPTLQISLSWNYKKLILNHSCGIIKILISEQLKLSELSQSYNLSALVCMLHILSGRVLAWSIISVSVTKLPKQWTTNNSFTIAFQMKSNQLLIPYSTSQGMPNLSRGFLIGHSCEFLPCSVQQITLLLTIIGSDLISNYNE